MVPLLNYRLITTMDELQELESEWNELLQRSSANNIFLTWEWVSSWWNYLGGGYKPWVLSIRQRDSEHLLGLAPLAQQQLTTRRGFKYRALSFIGSFKAAPDHLDFIIDAEYEQIVAPALIEKLMSLKKYWAILSLQGLSASSSVSRFFMSRPDSCRISSEVCPYIELPKDWESYQMTLGKKIRKNIRYTTRRLEEMHPGNMNYQKVESEFGLQNALTTLFELHTKLRKAHGENGAFHDNRVREFHQCVASLFQEKGWLRFYHLRVGGEDIALLYCFQYNKILSYYQSGYNLEWKEFSPGSQIIAHAIKQAIEERASEFDFLRGAEPYKFTWTNQVREDLNIELSSGFHRKLHYIYFSFDNYAQKIRQELSNKNV